MSPAGDVLPLVNFLNGVSGSEAERGEAEGGEKESALDASALLSTLAAPTGTDTSGITNDHQSPENTTIDSLATSQDDTDSVTLKLRERGTQEIQSQGTRSLAPDSSPTYEALIPSTSMDLKNGSFDFLLSDLASVWYGV